MLLWALLLACGRGPSHDTGADVDPGAVEVRVYGEDTGRAVGCAEDAAAGAVAGAVVWTPVEGLRPDQAVLTWQDCGPQPQGLVLPAGSALTLRNDRAERLAVDWQVGDRRGSAVLAPGAQRALSLPSEGLLTVRAAGQQAAVVLGGVGGVTDAQGRTSLARVPAGERELRVLHPSLGSRSARLSVPVGERVLFEVELR